MQRLHATCVAIDATGLLLRGVSGSGKSDLALRLIDGGARLVADDQVELRRDGGRLVASAPEGLRGLIEVRGLGLARVSALDKAVLGLVVELVTSDAIERLPEPADCEILGLRVPRLAVAPFQASAAALLRAAVTALGQDPAPVGAFQARSE
jgi:serine kinase of HPr protein (carbohydrate metabolism regulator)